MTNQRVLVVDDDSFVRESVCAMLEQIGFCGVSVPDGVEAIESFSAQPFSAVLMDCHMPHVDGLSATREIRATTPGMEARVIGMSGAQRISEALEAGMDLFLEKPFTIDELSCSLRFPIPHRQLGGAASTDDDEPEQQPRDCVEVEAYRFSIASESLWLSRSKVTACLRKDSVQVRPTHGGTFSGLTELGGAIVPIFDFESRLGKNSPSKSFLMAAQVSGLVVAFWVDSEPQPVSSVPADEREFDLASGVAGLPRP